MKRFLLTGLALLLRSVAAFAQYTNVLENAATQTVDTVWTNDAVWIGITTSSNSMHVIDGGMVFSTNVYVGTGSNAMDNAIAVTESGLWDIENNLEIGSGFGNSVTVTDGGTINVGDLVIHSNNVFNLNAGGNFAIASNFDASIDEFNWGEGGHLSVGGSLTGMAVNNNTVVLGGGRDLTLDGGTWNTGSTNLVVGDGVSVSDLVVSNGGWTVVGTGSTNDFAMGSDGGIAVGGTNGASLLVQKGSTVQTTGGLYVGGTNTSLFGSVTITNGSTVEAQSLVIGDAGSSLDIDNGGTLSIIGNYNADALTNVNWYSGGTLSVGGELTKSNGLDGIEHILILDGGNWNLGGDLAVTGTNNTLSIAAGGSVTNDNGYVGYAASDSNNTVLVSGDDSVWINNGLVYIGSTNGNGGNSVAVSDGGRVEADGLSVEAGNTFNLNSGGTLAITTNFNVSTHDNLVWNSGGNLSVGGELTGMATTNLVVGGSTNTYTYLGNGRDLTLDDGGIWNTGTNDLYVGAGSSGSDLVVENGGWVIVGGVQTNIAGGGMLVASTNGAQLVIGNGTVNVEQTLHLGLDANTTGTNIIRSGGMVSVGTMEIADGSLLDLQSGGTFAIATNFNASMTGFEWNDGGRLSVGGDLTGMAVSNNMYYLDGGRDLTLDGGSWDTGGTNLVVGYGSSDSDLSVKNMGTLSSTATYIGWDTNSANNTITVSDGGAWNNSGDLWVGYGGSGNALLIADGGTNTVGGSAYIGNTNTMNNFVLVSGSNSLWTISNNLTVGSATNGVDNYLRVSDSGKVSVGGDVTLQSGNSIILDSEGSLDVGLAMNVYSNSTLDGTGTIGFGATNAVLAFYGEDIALSTGIVFMADSNFNNTVSIHYGTFSVAGTNALPYVNFQTMAMDNGTIAGYGTLDTFDNIHMDGGVIDPFGVNADTARLEINGNFTSSGTVYRAQVYDTRWDQLDFTGTNSLDLSGLEAEVLVRVAPTGGVATILSATNIVSSFASTNVDDRLLLYNAYLDVTSNQVNVALAPNDGKLGASLDLAATESVRAGFAGMKNTVFTRTKQLRRNLVSTVHAIPHEAYLLTSTNAPTGAMGPGDQNSIFDMHVWLQQYSGQGDFDTQGISPGFDLRNNGTTIGADRLVGEALNLGFNYTYARSAARSPNGDRLDAETYWIGGYGEWVSEEGLYVDALAAYARSNYDSQRFEENYIGSASYRGNAIGAYADVGQYYYYGDLALSPYVGLHYLTLVVDGHSEKEEQGSVVHIDDVERDWLESALGLKLRHRFDTRFGRFQTTGYAEWTHDFIQDDVSSTLTMRGFPSVETARISPDADTVNVGIGYSWICTDYMEIGAGYNGRFSDHYEEHTGSLMLDIMF